MKKIFAAMCILLSLCFVLSGCSFVPFQAVDSLMKPPMFSKTDKELIAAFELAAGESTVFCTPENGEHKSAIVIEDIDNDKALEALIFYKLKNGQGIVRVNVLEIVDGSWKSVSDFSGAGDGVDSVSFVDLDADGKKEIFVLWRVGSSAGKVLSSYRLSSDEHSYQEVISENCSAAAWGDADSDGETELLLIGQTSTAAGNFNTAKLLKYSGGKMNVAGTATLDGNVSSYSSVKIEKTNETSPMRFYIDALKSETMMITEVVFWNAGTSELEAPFVDGATLSNNATLRYEPIPSMDINNDGSIDIPVQSEPPEKEDQQPVEITNWMDISDNDLIPVAHSYINLDGGYIFRIEDDELNNIEVLAQSESCWIFREKSGFYGSPSDLFSVLIIDTDDWNAELAESYTILYSDSEKYICAFISSEGSEKGITEKSLSSQIAQFKY